MKKITLTLGKMLLIHIKEKECMCFLSVNN